MIVTTTNELAGYHVVRHLGMVRALSVEVAGQGVRVNAIAPGGVETAVWDAVPMFADRVREIGRKGAFGELAAMATPLGRFATAEEIAEQIAFLLSDQAATITSDVENFTSTASRLTLMLASVQAFIANPFGYGYYGFYGAIQKFGTLAIAQVTEHTLLIVTELIDIVEELNNVSTKTTLFDFILVFGAPFIYFLVRLLRRMRLSDTRVRAALVYLFLSAMGTTGHQAILFFLGLALLVKLYPSHAVKPVPVRRRRPLPLPGPTAPSAALAQSADPSPVDTSPMTSPPRHA